MTRKDFQLIAEAIRTAPIGFPERAALAGHMVGYLAVTNPRFDKARFITAATSPEWKGAVRSWL